MTERTDEHTYPKHWEADVVLADGGTMHLRPIRPDDADRLVAMHARLSPESIRYRYFAPRPRLSAAEVERLTNVDYDERAALVAVLGDEIVAVGRYERLSDTDMAEVAFVVDDAHQGRGLGSVLLEHLAAIAAQRGIRRFEAEVLADNARMLRVFLDAGYRASRAYEENTVQLVFPIEQTEASLAVMQSREHRAEARSIARLLAPRSVAVVGASREPGSIGHDVMVNLLTSGFQGPVYPVNPAAAHVASVRSYPSVGAVPDDIDLAVVAVPAAAVTSVVIECARKRVRGLVVLSGGFGEADDPAGLAAERAVVAAARVNGMRVIGPNCLGVMNTAPEVRLNASLASTLPVTGRAGLFSQTWPLGLAILDAVARRGLGLSTFVSAGNRADVSGNDLLQYWEDDPATEIVLLHLESFGNARKFARLARRIGRRKPIVVVKRGSTVANRLARSAEPERAVDALFRQAGVVRVDSLDQLLDVAEVLTTQPMPASRRVAIVGNSAAPVRLAVDACARHELTVGQLLPPTQEALRRLLGPQAVIGNPLVLPRNLRPDEFREALGAVLSDPDVAALVAAFVPPMRQDESQIVAAVTEVARAGGKPVVFSFLGFRTDGRGGGVAAFAAPEVAVAALGRAAAYAQWRARPEGTVPDLPDIDEDAARAVVTQALAESPRGGALSAERVARLLAAYGVRVWPAVVVTSADQAVAAAAEVGYPVALKATAEPLRHRPELGTVRLDIADEKELRAAHEVMTARLGTDAGLAVQAMSPPGVATVIRTAEDRLFGALVSFGVGGVATDLLGDHAFRVLPLTDLDAAELIRSVRAAPLLFGYRGSQPVDTPALEQLLLRISRLADDLPEVAELELNPVIVARTGTSVLGATARVTLPSARLDGGPRRLA